MTLAVTQKSVSNEGWTSHSGNSGVREHTDRVRIASSTAASAETGRRSTAD
jgi:hypothetical protein